MSILWQKLAFRNEMRLAALFRFVCHQPQKKPRSTLDASPADVEQSFIVETARTRCLLWGLLYCGWLLSHKTLRLLTIDELFCRA